MFVYKTLSTQEIADQLFADEYANFSRDGAYQLAQHLESMAENWCEGLELDVVAVRCEFTEYEETDLFEDHGYFFDEVRALYDNGAPHNEVIDATVAALRDQTIVIELFGHASGRRFIIGEY